MATSFALSISTSYLILTMQRLLVLIVLYNYTHHYPLVIIHQRPLLVCHDSPPHDQSYFPPNWLQISMIVIFSAKLCPSSSSSYPSVSLQGTVVQQIFCGQFLTHDSNLGPQASPGWRHLRYRTSGNTPSRIMNQFYFAPRDATARCPVLETFALRTCRWLWACESKHWFELRRASGIWTTLPELEPNIEDPDMWRQAARVVTEAELDI